jgi:FPC/CPF motif-containing protein YcgG
MPSQDAAIGAFEAFIKTADFPCVGGKSALATGGMTILVAGDLASSVCDPEILSALQAPQPEPGQSLITRVVLFPDTRAMSEIEFETALWGRLAALENADRNTYAPDPAISSDPDAPDFGISLGGSGYFVVGMHPGASRLARRAPMAALAFNAHAQFRALKATSRYDRMRQVVRQRDVSLQGNTNPMLADHGDRSEAIQYSGRAVSDDWVCPFKATRHAA